MEGFGITYVEASGSATTVLVTFIFKVGVLAVSQDFMVNFLN
jgi:hypothetical protein